MRFFINFIKIFWMKTGLLIFGLFSFLFSLTNTKVYLCDSKNGKKFHYKKDCRGLKACTHEIILVDIITAKRKGKTICGFEN